MMIRYELKNLLQTLFPGETIIIDYVPKEKPGDYSTNLAFKIAARKRVEPQTLAEEIAPRIKHAMIDKVTVHAPGFINFTLSRDYLLHQLFKKKVITDFGQGKKVLIEYVSVNPTGPINIVNARAAVVGDALIRLLNKTGFLASSEYYINDGGRQTDLLAESVKQRMIELKGGKANIPENGYHGEYIIQLAEELIGQGIESITEIKRYSINYFVEKQKQMLEEFGVVFDNWVRESSIYKKNLVEHVLEILKKKEFTFRKDNALFFKATSFGDKRDRVIITSDGRYTYLLPDIAYHLDKIERKYERLIDIWGPDHYGHIKGLVGGLVALGYPEDTLKVIIVQEVKLKKQGRFITMSKRAGSIATLDELLEQVPKDVVRFFFLMRSCSQHLDFDIDLALKQSDENPVYYVQYAHARIMSIISFAKEKGIEYSNDFELSQLKEDEEFTLIKTLLKFPELLDDAVRTLEPYTITYYLIELARTFHFFYQKHKVVGDDEKLTLARLNLIKKTAETIREGLDILGVSCPERM